MKRGSMSRELQELRLRVDSLETLINKFLESWGVVDVRFTPRTKEEWSGIKPDYVGPTCLTPHDATDEYLENFGPNHDGECG